MVEKFRAAAEAVGATVKQFSSPAAAGDYLRELAGAGPVATSSLPGHYAGLVGSLALPGGEPAETALCISHARAGIAATGSLLLELGDPADRAVTALAAIHAVFLDPATIVPSIYDLGGELGALLAGERAYFSLTTGPSRTADIERVLTIGVHGPKELHILLVEEGSHE